jgi:hypothetical protein
VAIAGMEPGYMLLDTGASGFVLQTGLAAKAGLARFGRLNIAGLTGKVRRPRRAGFFAAQGLAVPALPGLQGCLLTPLFPFKTPT